MARDMAGSSAAEIDMPKRLTGRVYRLWAYVSALTAPVGRKLANMASTKALIWTTPRLKKTGKKLLITVLTFRFDRLMIGRNLCISRSTVGNGTVNCKALPITDPHAVNSAKGNWPTCLPNTSRATIIATFHTTGAV